MRLSFFGLTFLFLNLALADTAELLKSLDNTEWLGKAGIIYKGKLIGLPAMMTFKVHNGELYYLSAISTFLDSKIDEKAKGLCINSPPRKAKVELNADGKTYQGLVILPEALVSEDGTLYHKEYSIPIHGLYVDGDKLTLISQPLQGKGIDAKIHYQLTKNSTEELDQLAYKLHDCLESEPWKK